MVIHQTLNAINVANRKIGPGYPCMIIAEAGVNHNGSEKMAIELCDIAHEAGADAVKFQLYRKEEQVSRLTATADYQYRNTGIATALEMAEHYDLSWDSHHVIASRCRELGIIYLASCFDIEAVEFFMSIGGDCVKVASGEITNYPLLGYIATTGKTIILSTGMSTLSDVRGAYNYIKSHGDSEVVLLQCASNYPAATSSTNLLVMDTYTKEFGVNVGFSDHTMGSVAAVTAVAMGACIIEKHFTIDKELKGPDHSMSLGPDELRDFVSTIREAEESLGDGKKVVHSDEIETQKVSRRSIVASRFIAVGEQIDVNNVTLKRPNVGIDPRSLTDILGRIVIKDVDVDTPITWDLLS
jgi:N,N'-diacetyllegionaminate synthase